jgi:hypothetical protein
MVEDIVNCRLLPSNVCLILCLKLSLVERESGMCVEKPMLAFSLYNSALSVSLKADFLRTFSMTSMDIFGSMRHAASGQNLPVIIGLLKVNMSRYTLLAQSKSDPLDIIRLRKNHVLHTFSKAFLDIFDFIKCRIQCMSNVKMCQNWTYIA